MTAAEFVVEFRSDFPEFVDSTKYLDSQIEFWYSVAVDRLNQTRWGDLLMQGYELFVAHNMALSRQAAVRVAAGGIPGMAAGIMSSQSAGGVSESLNSTSHTMQNAGQWNLTTYGIQFYQLSQIVGMGGVQI